MLSRPLSLALPAFLAVGLAGCASAPEAPIPLPLPETLAWASDAGEAGAFLGLKTRENVSGSLDALDFGTGLKVARVVENSPAARAGIQTGDVVVEANGVRTDDPSTLDALVANAAPGAEWSLEVQRGDTVFAVPVTLGASGAGDAGAPRATPLYRLDPARSRAAWLTTPRGVVLVSAAEGSPFVRADVPIGSVVTHLEGERVVSDQGLIRALQTHPPGARVAIRFLNEEGEPEARDVTLRDEVTRVIDASIPVLASYHATADGGESSFVLLDLWILSLVRYERVGAERRWRLLRFFEFATGVGDLAE